MMLLRLMVNQRQKLADSSSNGRFPLWVKSTGQLNDISKCDLLRDNLAHPAKIDFPLEAIIVMKVIFTAMGQ